MAKLEADEIKLESSPVKTVKKTRRTWKGMEIKRGLI